MSTLTKKIMRRVYYAFALRLAFHRNTVHGVLALALLYALSTFVSFGAVIHNLSQVRVAEVDDFVLGALLHTEVWTLLGIIAFGAVLYSYRRALKLQKTSFAPRIVM